VPQIMSRRDHVLSRITLPTDAAGKVVATPASPEPDRVAQTGDPRLLRRLPWDYQYGPTRELLVACGFSLVSVVMPGTFLYRMVRSRRWSLRTLMMLPVVIAVMISMIHVFANLPIMRRSDNSYLHVAIVALSGTLALPFPWLALVWTFQGRWIRLALVFGTTLVLAAAGGFVGYLIAATHLDPLEQFEWTWRGCWNIWLPIAIVTGWVALAVLVLAWISRRFRRATTHL
jgi:hypothetical protein